MDFASPASERVIEETAGALRERGISVEVLNTKAEALERLKALIPEKASVLTGSSVSLKELGFEEYLKQGTHPWQNLKDEMLAEKDPVRQGRLRKQGVLADYFVGSVQAITQAGELVVASASGSQLAPYAFSSGNVVWVAGSQKITATLEDGIKRIREYVFPHENVRIKAVYGENVDSFVGKILIFEREPPMLGRKLVLLLVKESLGD